MNRVLSYQTAMRANSERDVREYVTKRTCVSLILSIAFFTLISGFLLGKFVADRHHHIKHLPESDIEFLKDLNTARENLVTKAQNLRNIPSNHSNISHSLNENFFTLYATCMKNSKVDDYDSLADFIINFIASQNQHQIQCLEGIGSRMENLAEYTTN